MLCACCVGQTSGLPGISDRALQFPTVDPRRLAGMAQADAPGGDGNGIARIAEYRRDVSLPARGHYLVRNALSVISMDPGLGDVAGGDVHIRDGEIVAVGHGLSAEGAEIIDARNTIVLPGFIDTHWHLWNSLFRGLIFFYGPDLGYFPMKLRLGRHYTPPDMYRGVQMGLAEALFSGITTVHNWAHNIVAPEHADANILAQLDLGVRGRFSYGYAEGQPADTTMDLVDVARVRRDWFSGDNDGMLSLGVALRGPENMPLEHRAVYTREIETARKLSLPITIHVAQHRAVAMKSRSISRLAEDRLLGSDMQLVHAIHATPAEIEAMAAAQTHLSLSPFTEMQAGMGFPQTGEMLAAGVLVSLSIDTVAVTGADMFGTMRSLLDVENGRQQKRALDPRQAVAMATIDGARDLGIADKVGSLTPGKRADLIMVRMDEVNTSTLEQANWASLVVRHAQPANIDTVLVDGRVLKRHGRLTAVDPERIRGEAAKSSADLVRRAGLAGEVAESASV